MTTVAASSACRRSRSDSSPAKRIQGSSGSGISLTPISASVRCPPSSWYVLKYSTSSSQPLPFSMRPPYSANGLWILCRARNAAPRDWAGQRPRAASAGAVASASAGVSPSAGAAFSGPRRSWLCWGSSTPQPTVSSATALIANSAVRNRRSTSVLYAMAAGSENISR